MTVENYHRPIFKHFLTSHKKNIFQELFRGLEPSFWRTNTSWFSFLYFDFKFKQLFRKKYKKQELSNLNLLFISIVVGSICNFISNFSLKSAMPLDLVKTLAQKAKYVNAYTFNILKSTYQEKGLLKLYVGWQFRLGQYIVQAILTCSALEELEIKRKNEHLYENGTIKNN
jgi:solute carrier family 25 carnitine/acylcarnitine transporter 20/29